MSVRYCTRCRQPYGEVLEGVVNVARDYAPFCSKRCADVDLVHWLKGDYVIGGEGALTVDDSEAPAAPDTRLPYDDGE